MSYILNPRITESQVGDNVSTKRTEISYGSNGYGLPETIEVFNGSGSIPMKKSVTTYNLSSTYTDRRIIGLPSMTESWGYNDLTSSLEYVGKVTYAYDEGDFSGTGQNISPTKHASGYGSTFIAGRGNLTTVKRWDMAYPTTESAATVSTLKYTTTTYNADDTPATVTDPRGTVTTYSYGNTTIAEKRAVLLGISYTVPSGSGIPDPSDVSFEYDSAGNRTDMTDGLGTIEYSFDELSRLKTESRNFTDTLADEPSGGLYTLTYNYHLTGGLKSIEDPWNNEVTYASDSVGRTTSIGANSFDGRTNGATAFTSGLSYRAFGAIKAMNYATDDVTAISLEFDNALRPTSYSSTSAANNDDIQDRNYTYYNDGMIHNVDNAVDGKYSQTYEYDFASRVTKNEFGESGTTIPYKQNIGYDAFNHITSRQTWDKDNTQRSFTAGYTNNRRSSGGYQSGTNSYDFSGNTTQNNLGFNNKIDWKFDAVGRMTEWLETRPHINVARDEGATVTFDGDGRSVKKLKRSRDRNITSNWTEETEYSIFSTVLGSVITTADTTGKKTKTNVYMGTSLVAEQTIYQNTPTIIFKNYDPVTNSLMETDSDGVKGTVTETGGHVELEALGAWVNAPEEEVVTPTGNYKNYGSIDQPEFGCTVDGSARSCSEVFEMLGKGIAVQCPDNNCGPRLVENKLGIRKLTMPFSVSGNVGGWPLPTKNRKSQESISSVKSNKNSIGGDSNDDEFDDWIIEADYSDVIALSDCGQKYGDRLITLSLKVQVTFGQLSKFAELDGLKRSGHVVTPVAGLEESILKALAAVHTQVTNTYKFFAQGRGKLDLDPVKKSTEAYAINISNEYGNKEKLFEGLVSGGGGIEKFWYNPDAIKGNVYDILNEFVSAEIEYQDCRYAQYNKVVPAMP